MMKCSHSRATACVHVITWCLVLITSQVVSQTLPSTNKAVIDGTRRFDPFYARAISTRTYNLAEFRVQLWTRVDGSDTNFSLHWQETFTPLATGPVVFNLQEDLWLNSSYLPGIMHKDIPGPLHLLGIYNDSHHFRLSIDDTTVLWNRLTPGESRIPFDDLLMPYRLPIFFCRQRDCPDETFDFGTTRMPLTVPPTDPPSTTLKIDPQPIVNIEEDDDPLKSKNVIIALIVWNAILSVLIFVIVMVLTSICSDLEKRKNERRREEQKGYMRGQAGPAIDEGHVAAESTWRSASSFDPSVGTTDTEALAASETVMHY